ncbi:MAG: late competence development ComFB family protein [Cyanobacteria bacterium CRU_2_1]|nr:late competence development ComFB family protein [Cyanobacteria bacterium RU_5_0]NJR60308.1 late competence development ComFB family protein [Cyanobacteria bacterium CRU_2_1]
MGIYRNAMEVLVEEEVTRQYKALPPKVASYVNPIELVAYALNQLPALYATSEKGLSYQLERGKSKFGSQITQAVHRAIAAIRRDPLRTHAPLQSQQSTPLREVLHQMRRVLRNDKIDWETLPTAVEQAINHASQGKPTLDTKPSKASSSSRRASAYPYRVSANPLQPLGQDSQENSKGDGQSDVFGWDDPLYNPR